MWTQYFTIEGMTSPDEASDLEKTVDRLESVKLTVFYKEGLGVLKIREDVSLEAVTRCIEDKGYRVNVMDEKAIKQSMDPDYFAFVMCAIACPLILIFVSLGGIGALISLMTASPIYYSGFSLVIAGVVFYLVRTRSNRSSRRHKGRTLKKHDLPHQ